MKKLANWRAAVTALADIHLAEFPPDVARLPPRRRLKWLDSAEAAAKLSRRAQGRLRRTLTQLVGNNINPAKAESTIPGKDAAQ